jgi:hypothetical protein
MANRLTAHHRDTLEKVFARPSSGNVEWRELLSLLDAAGRTTHEQNGKLKVVLGSESAVFESPRGKTVDVETLGHVRRLLSDAGFARPTRSA